MRLIPLRWAQKPLRSLLTHKKRRKKMKVHTHLKKMGPRFANQWTFHFIEQFCMQVSIMRQMVIFKLNCVLFCHLGIPVKLGTLTLLKWKKDDECEKMFRLVNEVSMKWREIGYLLGKNANQLDAIDTACLKVASECWCRVMTDWLENNGTPNYPASWKGLFTLLRDVGKYKVAKELESALFSVASANLVPSLYLLWPQLPHPFLLVRPHPFLLMRPRRRPLMNLYIQNRSSKTPFDSLH